jgi:hypothetical protein
MSLPGVSVDGSNSARVTTMRSVTWQPVAGDASGIKTLTLTVNGQPVTLTDGAYTFGGQSGGNGDYVLRAVAVDNSDNSRETTVTIRLRHPDFNRNGIVNQFEATSIMNAWGSANAKYDINLDGIIGSYELTYILNKWNSTL